MADKKAMGTLQQIEPPKPKAKSKADADTKMRGSVQTVRMDAETVKALKYASFERGISQNDIILTALRRDLGLEV